MINEQRVVTPLKLLCRPTISSTTHVLLHLVVQAIGSPEALIIPEHAWRHHGYFSILGYSDSNTKTDNLTLPAYVGSHTFNYAQPVSKEERMMITLFPLLGLKRVLANFSFYLPGSLRYIVEAIMASLVLFLAVYVRIWSTI